MEVLHVASRYWKGGDVLHILERERFEYEPMEDPGEFFIPYVWRLIVQNLPDLGWHRDRVVLDLEQHTSEEMEEEVVESVEVVVEEDSFVNGSA